MDQIKAEALNFFLCAATTISQNRPPPEARQVRNVPTPRTVPAAPARVFDRQGATLANKAKQEGVAEME